MALTLGDNFSYQGAKPLDARLKYNTLADMKAVADATMYDGCMAYCSGTDKTYQWKSTNTVDTDTGKWREFSSGGGSYTAGDGIVIDNDEISTDAMQEGDMDDVIPELPVVTPQDMEEICDPLPSVMSRYPVYSTSEQRVATWIDGKPIYQKTFDLGSQVAIATDWSLLNQIDYTVYNMDVVIDCKAIKGEGSSSSNNVAVTIFAGAESSSPYLLVKAPVAVTVRYLTLKYTKTTD